MNLLIDLFSGLGGASSAFVDDPAWRVLRLDLNPKLLEYAPDTVMCDITDTVQTMDVIQEWINDIELNSRIERLVVWASPPCYEFSRAFSAPAPIAQREGRAFSPNMKCVSAVKIILAHLGDVVDYWAVENVRGAIKHFQPFFGNFTLHHGPFFLWGNFPALDLTNVATKNKAVVGTKYRHAPNWLRQNKRGEIPYEFSEAFKNAIMTQTNLTLWTIKE